MLLVHNKYLKLNYLDCSPGLQDPWFNLAIAKFLFMDNHFHRWGEEDKNCKKKSDCEQPWMGKKEDELIGK